MQNEWSDAIPNDENALINPSFFDIDGSLGMVVRGAPFISNASISISQEPQNMPLQESIGFSMSVFDETNQPINPITAINVQDSFGSQSHMDFSFLL